MALWNSTGRLPGRAPSPGKTLVAISDVVGDVRAVLKLNTLGDLRRGATLIAPFFFCGSILDWGGLRSFLDFWEAFHHSAAIGDDLFPNLRARNMNS